MRVEGLLRTEGLSIAPLIARVPRDGTERLPLSFAQQRLWFIQQLEPESAAYNLAYPLRLRGPLDVRALERSLSVLVGRHETLRTVFPSHAGEAVPVIHPAAPRRIPLADLRRLLPEAREREVRRQAKEAALRPFDLAAGPLLRVHLVRLGEAEWGVLFVLHHIVSDGWSLGVLIR